MSDPFDPYYKWLGIRPEDQPPNYYRLLAVELFESDQDVIADAVEQRMAHVRGYQLGRHSELSQRILNEIAAAKVCLLDAEKKAAYDESLRQVLTPVDGPSSAPIPSDSPISHPLGHGRTHREAERKQPWVLFGAVTAGAVVVVALLAFVMSTFRSNDVVHPDPLVIRLGFVSRRFPDYVPQTTSSISISLPERN